MRNHIFLLMCFSIKSFYKSSYLLDHVQYNYDKHKCIFRKTGAVFHFSRDRLDRDAFTQQYLGVDQLNEWNHYHSIPFLFGRIVLGEITLNSIGNGTSGRLLG